MKATLEFDLPEDEAAYRNATCASAMHAVLYRFRMEWLRDKLKYAELSDAERACFEEVRAELDALLFELDVVLD